MKYKSNNQGCLSYFISSLLTVIFINYLITGFIDYIHSINMFIDWLNKSGITDYIKAFLGAK